jgi:hypothetical protein
MTKLDNPATAETYCHVKRLQGVIVSINSGTEEVGYKDVNWIELVQGEFIGMFTISVELSGCVTIQYF